MLWQSISRIKQHYHWQRRRQTTVIDYSMMSKQTASTVSPVNLQLCLWKLENFRKSRQLQTAMLPWTRDFRFGKSVSQRQTFLLSVDWPQVANRLEEPTNVKSLVTLLWHLRLCNANNDQSTLAKQKKRLLKGIQLLNNLNRQQIHSKQTHLQWTLKKSEV